MSIWQDHWPPRKNMPQVLSPSMDTMAHAKVEILIKEDTRQWDHGLIEGFVTKKRVRRSEQGRAFFVGLNRINMALYS